MFWIRAGVWASMPMHGLSGPPLTPKKPGSCSRMLGGLSKWAKMGLYRAQHRGHMEIRLNYCSQKRGKLCRDAYCYLNHNIGTRIRMN